MSVFLAAGCGKKGKNKDDAGEKGSLSGSLVVQSAVSVGTSLMGARPAETAFADVPAASGNYSFAKMDGIKVTIKEVRGADATSDNPLTTVTLDKEIELTDDPSNPIALNESIDWTAGDYSGIDLRLANSWSVKAYCKTQLSGTAFKLSYTTAAGVQTVDCASNAACSTMPADYDYYAYSFLDDYYTQNGGNPNIATHYKFTLAEGTTPKVTLLFDPTNTVACWDGQNWSSSAAIGVFRGPSDSRRPSLWPNGTAAFAVPVMPVLTYVTTDADEAAPEARTFFTASNLSALNGTTIDFPNTETVTILYKSDGTPITAVARNLAGNGGPILPDMEGFTTSSTGTDVDFYASGWYWAGGSEAPVFIRNRKFEGFALPATAYSVFGVTVKDGDDCGQTLTDHNGNNPSLSCLGSGTTLTHYWKEAVR